MIKIKRAGCPEVLKDSPSTVKRYNNPTVVATLWQMQHGKCCYCEQTVPDEAHGKEVEHYYPRSDYEELTNDWKNLLLACPHCNGKKSNNFPIDACGSPLIIDPSGANVDPEDHIAFGVDPEEAGWGMPNVKSDSPLGRTTIDMIGLYRAYYTSQRRYFHDMVLWPKYEKLREARTGDDPVKWETARNDFAKLLSANGRFAAYARAFARHKRVDTRFGINIPVGSELARDVLGAD